MLHYISLENAIGITLSAFGSNVHSHKSIDTACNTVAYMYTTEYIESLPLQLPGVQILCPLSFLPNFRNSWSVPKMEKTVSKIKERLVLIPI